MRIAFIYPSIQFDMEHHFIPLPMGLLSLTAVVQKKYDSNVDIFDSRHGAELPDLSTVNQYDVIGFTAMSMQITHALNLAKTLKDAGFTGKLVFGGPHASVAPDHLKEQPFIDAIFIGESEETFIEYLHFLQGKPHALQRLWLRDDDKQWNWYQGKNFISNLNTLPFPAREKYEKYVKKSRTINMTTTRGCPFKCNYCQPTKRVLYGDEIRRRSVDSIILEIENAVSLFAINNFSIDDDTFTFNKKIVLDFCERVAPLNLTWTCQSRSDIDRETLEQMHASGCNMIYVGVESGSQRVLNLMNKLNTVEKNAEFIKNCNEIGIKSWCNMMVGYPGETVEDMEKSLQFVRETKPSRVCVNQVTPFPGTYLWKDREDDIIAKDWDDIARHVVKPKFRSMANKQWYINYHIIMLSKQHDGPLNYDVIDSSWLLSPFKKLLPIVFIFPSVVPTLRRIFLKKKKGSTY